MRVSEPIIYLVLKVTCRHRNVPPGINFRGVCKKLIDRNLRNIINKLLINIYLFTSLKSQPLGKLIDLICHEIIYIKVLKIVFMKRSLLRITDTDT